MIKTPFAMPIVIWSLEGSLVRRFHSRDLLLNSVLSWLGHKEHQLQSEQTFTPCIWREQADNEVVRQTLLQHGISPEDWMVRAAMTHHERCLSEILRRSPCIPLPGIEPSLNSISRAGCTQMVISWATEGIVLRSLRSAKISDRFETQQIDSSGTAQTRLFGVFTSERGDMGAVMHAILKWADGCSVYLISANPREIELACKAGFLAVGLTSGGASPMELSLAGAQLVVTERTGLENMDRMLGLDRMAVLVRATSAQGEIAIL